ncbi:MAG: 3-hydroxyacyl-ACP dehydratase FabZ [Oscillospiraceae bacterium]|jgi:3-hydroxyacyl-[acyl-carrier-protein] dehydratase|nr:3-hydroxyacyl-ACP dehydratase FabZ [Oscillospiraceae bacterium]
MNTEQIKEILPHRDPFLLIDKVIEIENGVRAVAEKHIAEDSWWFKGHFPDYPVTPGVLLLEMLAQTGAVALLSLPENKGKIGLFGGADNVKFRRQVLPGDTVRLETEITALRGGKIGKGKGIATVNGEKACSAEITFAITDSDKG